MHGVGFRSHSVSEPLMVGAQRLRDRAVTHGALGGCLRLGALGTPDLVSALPQQYHVSECRRQVRLKVKSWVGRLARRRSERCFSAYELEVVSTPAGYALRTDLLSSARWLSTY